MFQRGKGAQVVESIGKYTLDRGEIPDFLKEVRVNGGVLRIDFVRPELPEKLTNLMTIRIHSQGDTAIEFNDSRGKGCGRRRAYDQPGSAIEH
jgi:hypothetical protein